MSHGAVINYTLDGVSIQPVTTKIQASFLTQLPEYKETAQAFHHEAKGDLKHFIEFLMAVIRKVAPNTNLIDRVKRRKPVQNTFFPKHACCLQ
jgi:hypothetical protein